jgi:protoheme IX farnesyltransferase
MATVTQAKTATLRDYLGLAKPGAVAAHLVTAAAAMFLAAGGTPPAMTLLFTLLGGGLTAGGSNVLNCYLDRDLDGLMARTRRRPLPAGRLEAGRALGFGVTLSVAGLAILGQLISRYAAGLAAAALLYYVVVYTLWLKRRTAWSVVIGSGIGAFPPLVGWVAVTGSLAPTPFLLSAVIALWTLPHVWALALSRRDEYDNAGVAMPRTRMAINGTILATLGLVGVSIALAIAGGLGVVYLVAAVGLGLSFVYLALRLRPGQPAAARRLYAFSIVYLVLLFGAVVADRLVSL